MSRQRSHCIIKKRPSNIIDEEIYSNIDKEKEKSVIIQKYNEQMISENDKFNSDNKIINRQSLKLQNDLVSSNLKKPVFKNFKKEYPSKQNKVAYIHEKAQIIGNFERVMVDEIEAHNQMIDFDKFLHQFKTEDEIRNLELQDILDIDYEKLDEIKYKALDFIDATSLLMDENEKLGQNTEAESDLLLFFSQKLQEMQSNEINLQIFVNNLEKVKGISYSNNGMKIFFKHIHK
jgi:hypothetical protein